MNRRFYPDNAIKGILVFVIVVIGGWYGKYSLTKLSTTPVPIRMGTGNTVLGEKEEQTPSTLMIPKQLIYPRSNAQKNEKAITLSTPDSPDKVVSWYKDLFLDLGYPVTSVKGTKNSDGFKTSLIVTGEKSEIRIAISKKTSENRTTIELN